MDDFGILLKLLQAAAIAAAAWMAVRLVQCGLARRFPILISYAVVLAALNTNSLVARLSTESALTSDARVALIRSEFYVWLVLAVASSVLALVVVVELHNHFLEPYAALQEVAQKVLHAGIFLAAAGVLLGVLTAPIELVATMRSFAHFGTVLVFAGLLLLCAFVALFTVYFHIGAAPNLTTILLGVGALFFSLVAWEFGAQIAGGIPEEPFAIVEDLIWAAAFAWIGWQLAPQEDRALATAPESPNAALRRLESLNETLTRSYER